MTYPPGLTQPRVLEEEKYLLDVLRGFQPQWDDLGDVLDAQEPACGRYAHDLRRRNVLGPLSLTAERCEVCCEGASDQPRWKGLDYSVDVCGRVRCPRLLLAGQ